MKTLTNSTSVSGGIARIMNDRFNARICFDANNDGGTPEAIAAAAAAKVIADAADKAAADKAAADKVIADAAAAAAAAAKGKPPTDAEAKLLKELMELKAKVKTFDGIDPEETRKLQAEKKTQEDAAKAAEIKALEAAGEFDRVKKMMADEHNRAIEALTAAAKKDNEELLLARAKINDLTIGHSFLNSNFIKTELVLPPTKARAAYGSHFEDENGTIVGYDKPAGAPARTKLVDGAGTPMDFETAMKRIVEADPDKDSIVRSKLAPGAGSTTTTTRVDSKAPVNTEIKGVNRMVAALNARDAAKKAG